MVSCIRFDEKSPMPNSQYGKRQIEEDDEEELKDLFTQVFHTKQK